MAPILLLGRPFPVLKRGPFSALVSVCPRTQKTQVPFSSYLPLPLPRPSGVSFQPKFKRIVSLSLVPGPFSPRTPFYRKIEGPVFLLTALFLACLSATDSRCPFFLLIWAFSSIFLLAFLPPDLYFICIVLAGFRTPFFLPFFAPSGQSFRASFFGTGIYSWVFFPGLGPR